MKKLIVAILAGTLLSACLLDSNEGTRHGDVGYVRMTLRLDRPTNLLMKSAWTDSTFELDSVRIILTAQGAATQTYTYPLQGRPDTGVISVGQRVYGLDPLRTWKAKIITLDTNVNPARTDTVHMDSVTFAVKAGDTVAVNFNAKAIYSVLRVRFVSTNATNALGAGIQYARIRVNGVTRDSLWILGNEAHNAVMFADSVTGWIAADGGKIWKSTDSGNTWFSQTSGTSSNLYAVWMNSTTLGWVAGANGTILRTKNGGTTWSAMPSGTTTKLNRVMFVNAAKGYAVGDGGIILKSIDSGSSWHLYSGGWFSQTSPNTANINATFFTSVDAGWAAGASGNILKTTNTGNTWTAQTLGNRDWHDIHFTGTTGWVVGDSGKIGKTLDGAAWNGQTSPTTKDLLGLDLADANTVWAVGEGETILKTTNGGTNWFPQTNGWYSTQGNTTTNLKSLNMGSATVGWAVGTGGYITKTTDGGLTWASQTSPTAQDLNTIYVTDANRAHAVGNAGVIVKSNSNGSAWTAKTSNTSFNLRDVDFVNGTTGFAVGDSETIMRTTDSSTWYSMPGGWTSEPTGITDTILDMNFFNGSLGVAVGRNGKIIRSDDGGDSWTVKTSGTTKPLRGVRMLSATALVTVGDQGTFLRSTDAGATWTATVTVATSTTDSMRAVNFTSATAGYAVGDGGSIRVTTDGGVNWTAKQTLSPVNATAIFRGVHSNGTWVWAVGDGGILYEKTPIAAGTMTAVTSPGSSVNLNAVQVITNAIVVAVGNGGLIRRSTNANNGATSTWSTVGAGLTGANLRKVWFKGTTGTTDTGYAVGDSGVVLKSVNSGANWVRLSASGAVTDLKAFHERTGSADSIIAGGAGGLVYRSLNSGVNWTGQAAKRNFYGVDFASATTGFVVASDGRVLKTTTGGTEWSVVDNTVATALRGVYFKDANTGWVVGDNGVIRKTVNGGTGWSTQTSGTTANLLRVHFRGTTDTGWIAGEGGTLLRTFDGGTNWWRDTTEGSTQALRGVFVRGRDTTFAAGDSGIILRTTNNGQTVSGASPRADLKGTYAPSSTVIFAVGAGGLILKTTNGGSTWAKQTSGVTQTLNAVIFPTDVNTGYVVGAAGKILKTTNGGTNWTAQTVGTDDFFKVHFTNASIGYATGGNGKIYRTVDAGVSWVAQASGTTESLNGVFAANTDTVFAVGNNGTILKSRDSGAVLTSLNLNSTYFRGDTGYVVGANGISMRTGNGAASWTFMSGTTANLNDCFISPSGNNIYGVGDGGTYLSASNATAPTAWTVRNSGTTRNFQGVWVSGSSPGPAILYAVGDSGIVRANTTGTLGDMNATLATGTTTQPLRSIQCIGTSNKCWAAGGNETVLRTTDGAGTVWVVKTTGPKVFDLNLVTKYIKPGVTNTINLQAIDRASPLRGYEANYSLNLSAGQDSTITSTLSQCGYPSGPTCTP